MPEGSVREYVEVDLDVRAFTAYTMERGWGDGLPLIPPTEDLVAQYVAASGRHWDDVVAKLPLAPGPCTVEKIAVNAAMAGAIPAAMPLLLASIEATAHPDFNLAAVNSTTGAVVPALIVNGKLRHDLGIPFGPACFGGAAGNGPAIGRALRLVMRNVGGQIEGLTSQSVHGQPGRISGIVVGEWEERSPWAPLGERRGVPGDALTVYGAQGTADLADITSQRGRDLLTMIGRSLAYPATAAVSPQSIRHPEVLVALCPGWAAFVADDVPAIEDVQHVIWEAARIPISMWPKEFHHVFEECGRVDPESRVPLVEEPGDVIVMVAGGDGGHHTTAVHGFIARSQTVPVSKV
jgi:hypothetical protein